MYLPDIYPSGMTAREAQKSPKSQSLEFQAKTIHALQLHWSDFARGKVHTQSRVRTNTIASVLGLLTPAGSTLKSISPSRVLSFTAGHYLIR